MDESFELMGDQVLELFKDYLSMPALQDINPEGLHLIYVDILTPELEEEYDKEDIIELRGEEVWELLQDYLRFVEEEEVEKEKPHWISIHEVELRPEYLKEIEEAKQQVKNGEVIKFENAEEAIKYFEEEDRE